MSDTERETSTGTQLANEAGTALGSIFAVVERQAREIERINQMAMQQLQSSGTVVQIMQAVSNSTQQSNAGTRKAAQNLERLARLAEQLLISVEAFKLRDHAYNNNFRSRDGFTQQRRMNGSLTTVREVSPSLTGAAQPPQLVFGMYNNLPAPASPATPYPPFSAEPYQQNSSQRSPMQPRKDYQKDYQ
jgi:hypothetical protein